MIDLTECAATCAKSAAQALVLAIEAKSEGDTNTAREYFADARSLSMEQSLYIIAETVLERLRL